VGIIILNGTDFFLYVKWEFLMNLPRIGLYAYTVKMMMAVWSQGDHLSEKPGNVREFETCQGNVSEFANSQGIVRE